MGRAKLYCLPLALLFLANAVPSEAQKGAAGDGEEIVRVAAGAPLMVECRLRPEQRAEWQRDGAAPPDDLRSTEAAAGALLAARLSAPAARAHHAGLYTCSRARDHRVRVVVLPVRAGEAPVPVTSAPLSPAAAEGPSAGGPSAGAQLLMYDVRGNFSMRCTLDNPTSLPYAWAKNNTDVNSVPEMKDRFVLEQNNALLVVHRSIEEDYGNYSCSVGAAVQRWELRGRPHPKLPANTNVVEGQKLTIKCKLIGKPYPPVAWQYSNNTDSETKQWVDVSEVLGGRVVLNTSETGVPNGALIVAAAARADAGAYRCVAGALSAETVLRVKDMYAALWPFLGICAEVFVLCAVILVYERRRTKPEADDSDVDTNDQKKS